MPAPTLDVLMAFEQHIESAVLKSFEQYPILSTAIRTNSYTPNGNTVISVAYNDEGALEKVVFADGSDEWSAYTGTVTVNIQVPLKSNNDNNLDDVKRLQDKIRASVRACFLYQAETITPDYLTIMEIMPGETTTEPVAGLDNIIYSHTEMNFKIHFTINHDSWPSS